MKTSNNVGFHYSLFGDCFPFNYWETNDTVMNLNPFRFSSEYFDSELGLIAYNYRHYNPLDGRFLSRDPIGESGGYNLYGFCNNDPINNTDYLGLIKFNLVYGFVDETLPGVFKKKIPKKEAITGIAGVTDINYRQKSDELDRSDWLWNPDYLVVALTYTLDEDDKCMKPVVYSNYKSMIGRPEQNGGTATGDHRGITPLDFFNIYDLSGMRDGGKDGGDNAYGFSFDLSQNIGSPIINFRVENQYCGKGCSQTILYLQVTLKE